MSVSPTPPRPEAVSLQGLNSLGLPAWAADLVELRKTSELVELSQRLKNRPRFILGGGSNIVLATSPDEPLAATVIHNQLQGIVRLPAEPGRVRLRVAAGESWHRLVMWTLSQGWGGLENLALIPGTVGAAPIQNIGAYGLEVSDRIDTVHAWDFEKEDHVAFPREACSFAYRWSQFKDPTVQGPWDQPRYLITGIDLSLWPASQSPRILSYAGLAERLQGDDASSPSPLAIAHAVMSLRRSKLPDPEDLGNVGSFFQNPVVPTAYADALRARNTDMPSFPATAGQTKLSAGWLIDSLGFRGQRRGDAGVFDRHALVLVNHGTAKAEEMLALAREIQRGVMARYGVWLTPEPQVVPPAAASRRNTGRSGEETSGA